MVVVEVRFQIGIFEETRQKMLLSVEFMGIQ